MILNKIMFKLALIGIGVFAIKVGTFYFIAKLKQQQYQKSKPQYKNNSINSVPDLQRPIPRNDEIERKYTEVKLLFNRKMKNKEMNRSEILALKNYLKVNVHEYEHKKFKNDAHAIYSMMKAKDLTLAQLNKIKEFLNTIEGIK